MKKTYHGQSDTLVAYCIRAAVVSLVIVGSAIFFSANAGQVSLQPSPLINIRLQQPVLTAVIYNCNSFQGTYKANGITFGTELFFKGTINKRPGFSKPGLI